VPAPTKGAPESVLERCPAVPDEAKAFLQSEFAAGSRVVAVATRPAPELEKITPAGERDLQLAGFLVFLDPPKATAGDSLARLALWGANIVITHAAVP
jgi:Mg2+-importing ATPase